MTLNSLDTSIPYVADGTTTLFPIPFKFNDEDHIKIYEDGVLSVATITISGAGNDAGGSATYSVAPASGTKILVSRQVPLRQNTEIPNNGTIPSEVLENRLDEIYMALQEIQSKRAITIPIADPSTIETELDDYEARASSYFVFDSNGSPSLSAIQAALSNGEFIVGVTSGTNTYTLTPTPALTAYSNTNIYLALFGNANTSSTVTINISGLGAKNILTDEGAPLSIGQIKSGYIGAMVYDGTAFRLINPVISDLSVKELITQASHGFAIGDVLKFTGGAFAKALGTTGNSEAVGIVESVPTSGTFFVVYSGRINGLSGLTANTEYYLSPSTAGLLTSTAPSASGQVRRTIMYATSTTSGIVRISPAGFIY